MCQLYEECHAENRQLSHDIHGVRGQLDTVKHQLELAAEVGTYSDTRAGNEGYPKVPEEFTTT